MFPVTSMNNCALVKLVDVHKVYRRYSRRKRFATLKSALLSGSVLKDLRPDAVFEALKGVSFDVAKGKTCGMVGRNGSGKSTMLRCINLLETPDTGRVYVAGELIKMKPTRDGHAIPEDRGIRSAATLCRER